MAQHDRRRHPCEDLLEYGPTLSQWSPPEVLRPGCQDIEHDELRGPPSGDRADPPTCGHPGLQPLEVQPARSLVPCDDLAVEDHIAWQPCGQDRPEVGKQGSEVGAVAGEDPAVADEGSIAVPLGLPNQVFDPRGGKVVNEPRQSDRRLQRYRSHASTLHRLGRERRPTVSRRRPGFWANQ